MIQRSVYVRKQGLSKIADTHDQMPAIARLMYGEKWMKKLQGELDYGYDFICKTFSQRVRTLGKGNFIKTLNALSRGMERIKHGEDFING